MTSPQIARPRDPDYPGLRQSVFLTCLVVVALIPFAILEVAIERGLSLDISFWTDAAAANVLAFGLVLFWGCRRTGLPYLAVLRLRAFPPRLVAALLLFAASASILLSEADNLLRMIWPMPPWILEILLDENAGSASRFLALVVVAPLTEELLFRGLVLRGLIAQRGVWGGVFYSSLLFGLVHLNPWQFIPAFALGIVLGWIFVRSRSLLPCILLHAAFNVTAFLLSAGQLESWGVSIPGYSGDPSGPVSFQPAGFDLLGLLLAAGSLLWMKSIFERDAKRASSTA